MEHYAGIDVSLELSSVCVVDATGRIVREAKVASEPEALIAWFRGLGLEVARVGLEAGPLSQWLYAAMREAGLAGGAAGDPARAGRVQGDAGEDRPQGRARHRAADAAGLVPARALQVAAGAGDARAADRAQAAAGQAPRRGDEPARGAARLRAEGRADHAADASPGRIRELVDGHPTLTVVAEALLAAREALGEQLRGLEKRLRDQAREDERARLLMTTPGVGVIVALTFAAAVDDPARFRSSKAVGAHFGLTPRKYQSGETDVTGRISKIGDAGVRTALYEAANVILTRPVKGSALKSWAARLAKRAGMRKAKVALARKLAVVLHRMLADGTPLRRRARRRGGLRARRNIEGSGGRGHQPPGARSRRRDDGSGQAAQAKRRRETTTARS